MRFSGLAMQIPVLLQPPGTAAALLPSFSNSTIPFSSQFQQPEPPMICPEYRANWVQHTWNVNVSNIASGFLYNSPSQKKVRVDSASDMVFLSSLFEYEKTTDEGVFNTLWTLSPAIASAPTFWSGYVEPAFPLVTEDLLVENGAVYQGPVEDKFLQTEVIAWDILYKGILPTTVFVGSGIVHGYDFWSPDKRTRVITRMFNIIPGTIAAEVFEFPLAEQSQC